jgi:hypothetical protein
MSDARHGQSNATNQKTGVAVMASGNANVPSNPAGQKRICEKCRAEMKPLGVLPAVLDRAAIKVFRCYGCDHVISE